MNGILYVVGTPIGNLGDMTFRAIETLKFVDFIAAEDTRVTQKLLNHFKIDKKMISYFEHNKIERGKIIIRRIKNGENCALVTDAGMPAISDPGELIVKQCYEENIDVKVVPGPSACISALSISGLSTGRFSFEGFLSINKKRRKDHLEEIKYETRTMIFYEAPHKLLKTLKDIFDVLGNRKVSIIHELTKVHESVLLGDLDKILENFSNLTVKGEYVLIIEGYEKREDMYTYSLNEALSMALKFIKKDKLSLSDASKETSKITGISKNNIYKEVLKNID